MTRNQLQWHANRETERANKANEAETNRANLAREAETYRHNRKQEKLATIDSIANIGKTLLGKGGINTLRTITKSVPKVQVHGPTFDVKDYL